MFAIFDNFSKWSTPTEDTVKLWKIIKYAMRKIWQKMACAACLNPLFWADSEYQKSGSVTRQLSKLRECYHFFPQVSCREMWSSDGLGDPKPENPTGKPDILGHPNPTRTRGVYTRTRPETRHSKPENPRYFQGIQNIEILTKKVVIFV